MFASSSSFITIRWSTAIVHCSPKQPLTVSFLYFISSVVHLLSISSICVLSWCVACLVLFLSAREWTQHLLQDRCRLDDKTLWLSQLTEENKLLGVYSFRGQIHDYGSRQADRHGAVAVVKSLQFNPQAQARESHKGMVRDF